jgi:cold shock CspA family protein
LSNFPSTNYGFISSETNSGEVFVIFWTYLK